MFYDGQKKKSASLALERDFDFILLTVVYLLQFTPEGNNPSEFMTVYYINISGGLLYKESWYLHNMQRYTLSPPSHPQILF